MRAGAMFLLLLAAICAVSATSDTRNSYKEALAASLGQQAAASVRLNSADHYRSVDHVCFRASESCGGCGWLWSHLTCCKHDSPYERRSTKDNFLRETGPTVGHCQLEHGACLQLSDNVYSCGVFALSCELSGEAGACGPHDCGELVLNAQGQAMSLDHAVVDGDRPDTLFPNGDSYHSCYAGQSNEGITVVRCEAERTNRVAIQNDTRAGQHTQRRSTTGAKFNLNGNTPKVTLAEYVFIFSGPVTISSKTHDTKWKEGWFEYVNALGISQQTAEYVESTYGKLPRIDSDAFNNYKFQLFKNKGYY